MWVPKKSVPCCICEEKGRKHYFFTESEHYYQTFYSFNYYNLCHWCWQTLVEHFSKPVNIAQIIRIDDKWREHELTRTSYYFHERELRKLSQYIKDLKIIKPQHKNPIVDADIGSCILFLCFRESIIDIFNKNNLYKIGINQFRLLKYDKNSYIKYLPLELIDKIINDLI